MRNFIATTYDVPSSTIDQYLTIHQGDATNPIDVAKALISPMNENHLVDVIVSGVGAYPKFQWSIRQPFPLTNPTICEDTINAMYKALSNLSLSSGRPITKSSIGEKPLLVVVSTAGCGRQRGIPLPIYLPYHYFLSSPLADKKRMEELVFADKGAHFRDFVVLRPLILTDGEAKGDGGLRVGWEWGVKNEAAKTKEPGLEVGYSVSRRDVGNWTFEKVIVQGGWEGKCVYLTY